MDIMISNASGEPIYAQIISQVKSMILSGALKEGEALPSMRNLAMQLRAIEALLAETAEQGRKCGLFLSEMTEMLQMMYGGDDKEIRHSWYLFLAAVLIPVVFRCLPVFMMFSISGKEHYTLKECFRDLCEPGMILLPIGMLIFAYLIFGLFLQDLFLHDEVKRWGYFVMTTPNGAVPLYEICHSFSVVQRVFCLVLSDGVCAANSCRSGQRLS